MADVHTPETRSNNMSQIRSKNTKPELVVRQYLFANGLRYRLHRNDLSGKPDIVLPKYNTVIFVHGCFWHGHNNCKNFVLPKTKTEWWKNKITANQNRDLVNINKLEKSDWNVIEIFECELKKDCLSITLSNTLSKIIQCQKK